MKITIELNEKILAVLDETQLLPFYFALLKRN
jgi:hypothetical protein